MSNLGGGDSLARGAHSAQFAGGAGSQITQFEDDLIFRPEILKEKYGLSDAEIEQYKAQRERGEKLPEVLTVSEKEELSSLQISVVDRRPSYGTHPLAEEAEVVVEKKKWPEPAYETGRPILDRVIVMRFPDDPNLEILEDGSARDKRTGFIILPQYRQHSNTGIVIAIGDFVVMGGVKTDLKTFVNPGDKVTYGDYNSEIFHATAEKVEAMCDAVKVNYNPDPEAIRIIRVQDIRLVEHPLPVPESETIVLFDQSKIATQEQANAAFKPKEERNG